MQINGIHVDDKYVMTVASKANQVSRYQPKTVIENDKAYQTMKIRVTFVEDRGDYFYIGYAPIEEDSTRCSFGYARIYKSGNRSWGIVKFDPMKQ